MGGLIGEVQETDTSPTGECVGSFLRVRVLVRIDRPLRRILRVDVLRDGTESIMLLRYERLPDHCYRYGRLGHVVRDCLMAPVGEVSENYNLMFGSWLRASSPIRSGKTRTGKEGVRWEGDLQGFSNMMKSPNGKRENQGLCQSKEIGRFGPNKASVENTESQSQSLDTNDINGMQNLDLVGQRQGQKQENGRGELGMGQEKVMDSQLKRLVVKRRGLGNTQAFQILCRYIMEYNPEIMFLMETKVNHVVMENIRVKLGYAGKFVVDVVGRKGGLCLFWSDNLDVSLLSYSLFHIDVRVVSHNDTTWRFTGFYGHPESNKRSHAWNLLRRLCGMSKIMWMCAGDFNEVLEDSEKLGGLPRPRHLINNFRNTLDDYGLQDMGFLGPLFTLCNRREGEAMIQERLDKCICDIHWRSIFTGAVVRHLNFGNRVIGLLSLKLILELDLYRVMVDMVGDVSISRNVGQIKVSVKRWSLGYGIK
ncbi:hypothetical protein Ddye_014994 [Dipteronia dyeriana]|uniref:Endonuclease/exonuclease/phosphatase domain-containing protein n=1 Tax=Dipteronia dyeriana TaxID=168575 RepID=A0AAD9WZ57_9ROSI|nr:hypothetical protein Ddye_014994 [Dipteronia dyeriana]